VVTSEPVQPPIIDDIEPGEAGPSIPGALPYGTSPVPLGPNVPTRTGAVSAKGNEPLRIIGKETEEKPLSADQIKAYGLDPTDPQNVGLSLDGVKKKLEARAQSDALSASKALPSLGDWQQKTSSALSKFAPRNENVKKQVNDNAAAVRSSIESGIKQVPDAIFNVMLNESDKNRAETRKKISDDLSNGNYLSAVQTLKTAARTTAETESRKAEEGRDMMIKNLGDALATLNEYKSKGGNIGLITGNVEDLASKLGTVKNKELRKLGTRFSQFLIEFRRAYTGATFTPQESAQYEALLPSIKGNFALNTAKIEGLAQQAQSNSDNFYRSKLGDSLYNNLLRPIKVMDVNNRQEGYIPIYEFNPNDYLPLEK
jgi:hypothetical protein